MSNLNECLVIWEREKRGSAKWSALSFDAVRQEAHAGENIITKFPVSTGFMVSEHTIRQNARIKLETVISSVSNPTAVVRQTYEAAFQHLITSSGGIASGVKLDEAEKFGRVDYEPTDTVAAGDLDKVQKAFKMIRTLVQTGTLVHVLTMRETYINCVIQAYNVTNDVTNPYSIPMTLELEELIIAEANTLGTKFGALSDAPRYNINLPGFIGDANVTV